MMANWYKIPPTFRVSQSEYRSNIDGLNIVFGAVLGFVLAGAEGLPPADFMIVLLMSASVVVSILYLGSSEYRLFYAISTAIFIAFLPYLFTELLGIKVVPKLQPTLAVWAGMILLVELMPRERRQKTEPKEQNS